MTRLPIPSSGPPTTNEAGQRFQLPPTKEKRTQASTMFSTTAKNLTSNIPFRWRQGQVDIFEDWILSRGPNAATVDLVPLLRELDLDGYEDIKNKNGECVHDLIIDKVRRKISRTKRTVATQIETKKVKQAERAGVQMTIEKGPSQNNCDLLTLTASLTTHGHGQEPSSFILEKASLADPCWSSSRAKAPGPTMKGLSNKSESTSELEVHGAQISPSRFRGLSGYRTTRKNNNLKACIDKLKVTAKEIWLEIDRLPPDIDAAALETAAHDTTLEIEHLENLINEYMQTKDQGEKHNSRAKE
ncbi:hypothetical protein F5Y12DRAFT_720092 [Xylaria sp. FL1777]|nr:hypothetical protein F5Y12DRAFT_720092 [Xylaria sp. FL1777]